MPPLEPNSEGNFTFASDAPFALELGGQLQPVTLRYALYGKLNARRDNAILVCHALSGSPRIADWWSDMFAPPLDTPGGRRQGGIFDLERFCIIGVNILGSCYGSTGPTSINPLTGQPYGPDFPLITVADIVRAQALLLDHLAIPRLSAVIGGSIGGMQALQWAVGYPDRVDACICIGSTSLSAMGLALNHLQRQAILNDPAYGEGRYTAQPAQGLGLARQIAMISYKSAALFTQRYGRSPDRSGEDPYRSLAARYDIAGYLDHQGEKFISRFDANSYLTITKTMDNFDLGRRYGSEAAALRRIRARVLLVGISTDWLFPPAEVHALAARIAAAGAPCEYREFLSDHGHDGFLADPDQLVSLLAPFFGQGAGKARVLKMV